MYNTLTKAETAIYAHSVFMKNRREAKKLERNDRMTSLLGVLMIAIVIFVFSGTLHDLVTR